MPDEVASHFGRDCYRNWLNDHGYADVVGPVIPCELAANVSVQGRGRASERDSEGSRLSRVQRQRGWLEPPLRRPDWRKMYRYALSLPTFVTLRVSVSVPAKSPIAREATFKSLGLSE